jgi:hypothetical protein
VGTEACVEAGIDEGAELGVAVGECAVLECYRGRFRGPREMHKQRLGQRKTHEQRQD